MFGGALLLEIGSDGKVVESQDRELIQHYIDITQHMIKDVKKEPKWRGHMCVEEKQRSVFQTTKDLSHFQNAQFANSCIQFLGIEGQIAVLVRKESMLIIDKDRETLHSINFGKHIHQKEMHD